MAAMDAPCARMRAMVALSPRVRWVVYCVMVQHLSLIAGQHAAQVAGGGVALLTLKRAPAHQQGWAAILPAQPVHFKFENSG